jgi:DNA-directed RNA polymerase subunit K/omega
VSDEAAPGSQIPGAPMLAAVGSGVEHRFLFVSVAAQRVVQIRNGARPRVDAGSHKATVVAVAEVLAGFVPYIAS